MIRFTPREKRRGYNKKIWHNGDPRKDQDLKWYFELGIRRDGSTLGGIEYCRRIERALDGDGDCFTRYYVFRENPSVSELALAYALYRRNWARNAVITPHVIVPWDTLLRMANRDKPSDEQWSLDDLTLYGKRSTWGDCKVTSNFAGWILLRLGLKATSDEDAFEKIAALAQAIEAEPIETAPSEPIETDPPEWDGDDHSFLLPDPWEREERQAQREAARRERFEAFKAKALQAIGRLGLFAGRKGKHGTSRKWFDCIRPLLDVGDGKTTAEVIAKLVRATTKRRINAKEIADYVTKKGCKWDLDWFASYQAIPFWNWIECKVQEGDFAALHTSRFSSAFSDRRGRYGSARSKR